MRRLVWAMILLLAAELPASGAPESGPAQPVVQPEKIPGKWKLAAQPLPPLAEIEKQRVVVTPVYGLYTWAGEYVQFRGDIKKVGWKSFRVGGPLDDEAMKAMAEDGVEVVKTLGLRDIDAKGEKKNRLDFKSDEEFLAAYVQGVERFLARYGPDGTLFKENPKLPNNPIKHVEIWNEPNFQYMIPDREPQNEVQAERDALYAKVLPAAYEAIKKKWPAVTVVGFGAGGSSRDDVRFVGNVFKKDPAKIAKSFDILSTHPYVNPVPPEANFVKSWGEYSVAGSLKDLRDILKKNAAEKPIWYTECGWAVSKADGGAFEMKPDQTTSPLLQAAYVVRMYALAMRLGVERCHIMYVSDADNYNAGFFARAGAWRPSAYAAQTMIKIMPNPKLTRVISDGENGYFAYMCDANWSWRQDRPPPPVIMAWNVAGPKTVEILNQQARVTVTDMLGHSKEVETKGGIVTVQVGPCPVYIQ